jgi:creatinine amidohydrolase
MFPDQVRQAIKESWPVVLPVGVLEYHAEHCVVGVDTLLVVRAVELLEKETDLVVLPPFYYGAGVTWLSRRSKGGRSKSTRIP